MLETMMGGHKLFGPVLVQVLLTLVVSMVLYARRLPPMFKAKLPNEALQDKDSLKKLPAPARFAADNYNHQFEAPVLFYVVCLGAILTGLANELTLTLAWAYVAARIVHAIIQCTTNVVMQRFAVFSISMFILIAMTVDIALRYWA